MGTAHGAGTRLELRYNRGMSAAEERLKILQMIQDGIITPEDGVRLLDALGAEKKVPAAPTIPAVPDIPELPNEPLGWGQGARWLRVRVTDINTNKTRVNIRLPISVLSAGVKMGARFSAEVEGMDMNQLMALVRSGMTGQVVDVIDEKDGEHVEVFLE